MQGARRRTVVRNTLRADNSAQSLSREHGCRAAPSVSSGRMQHILGARCCRRYLSEDDPRFSQETGISIGDGPVEDA